MDPFIIAKGNSMLPVLHTGDRVEVCPVKRSGIRRGDVLVFTADGRRIIHRVVKESPLQTRGDNCGRNDRPVPADSPVFLATAFRRNGKRVPLPGGAAGFREFRRNQRRRRVVNLFRKMAAPLAGRKFFRIPFRKLTACTFAEKTVYYAGRFPVGWLDKKGWHWMRFACYFVETPPENLIRGHHEA